MKIADGLAMLSVTATLMNGPGEIHPALIWDEQEALLVDAGLPGQLEQFREAMTTEGVPFERLGKIIITHADMDHVGGLAGMLRESPHKISVLSHAKEKPYIQAEQPPLRLAQIEAQIGAMPEERRPQMQALYESLQANYKKLGVQVDRTVDDGEELPIAGGISIIYTPGHTAGHICLHHKRSKTLVAGDALNAEGGSLNPSPAFMALDREAFAASLRKLTLFDIENVICYHGGLYQAGANERLKELAERYTDPGL